ncbi:hypothetical protein KIH27_00815 [Mycobacterium sp. M1]|uniref:Chitin-binding type-2 domain-containing protein n=1 Tax=Mycolicibacter acidiphilus TaxID=2835306 RepID=A0ABS5RD85_9MYCO|nr:hypothetical protein [Mycolicibacter acidiphilus]MBS9532124.1 hypothetical protein [Mycolicibacter acidiphilus]
MNKIVCGLTTAVATAAAPFLIGLLNEPAVSSAAPPLDCPGGQYWEPSTNTCMPLGQGPTPLDCPGGQYWEPSTNTCMPLGQGPTPLDCPPGQWWNPFGNACRPLGQM